MEMAQERYDRMSPTRTWRRHEGRTCHAARARRTPVAAAMIVALAGAVALDTWAQYPGGSGNPGGGDRRGGMGGSGRGKSDTAKSDQAGAGSEITLAGVVQLRLAELEEDLKLTPVQRPLWTAYHGQVMKLLTDVSRAGTGTPRGEANAPQQFDRLADVARNRLAAIEDIADAGKALYAKLAPEQQALADRRLALAVLPLSGGESLRTGSRPVPPPRADNDNSNAGPGGGPGRSK
jgi:hypothetical protein